ncbi:MAG: zinc ribbon domain-containing protein [Clostridiales bacterium]|nr:zinc ribbon domain-containing protein [Clostridiales bacterium]
MICNTCGKEIETGAMFCTYCGMPVTAYTDNTIGNPTINNYTQNNSYAQNNSYIPNNAYAPNNAYVPINSSALIQQLSQKLLTNGIIWIVVAVIQIFLGLFFNWFLAVVGVLNIVSAVQDIQASNKIKVEPIRIVDKYEPLAAPIISLVYNVIFGGLIGVAGSIYYLVAIRDFVIKNRNSFIQIEADYLSRTNMY